MVRRGQEGVERVQWSKDCQKEHTQDKEQRKEWPHCANGKGCVTGQGDKSVARVSGWQAGWRPWPAESSLCEGIMSRV